MATKLLTCRLSPATEWGWLATPQMNCKTPNYSPQSMTGRAFQITSSSKKIDNVVLRKKVGGPDDEFEDAG
jgi:hypothetical protein